VELCIALRSFPASDNSRSLVLLAKVSGCSKSIPVLVKLTEYSSSRPEKAVGLMYSIVLKDSKAQVLLEEVIYATLTSW
jgi:hypothetical protein